MASPKILHPRQTDQVFGVDDAINFFDNFITKDNISRAFLITGSKGYGKATLAYHLAAKILSVGKENKVEEVESLSLFGDVIETPKIKNEINTDVKNKISEGFHPDLFVIEFSEDSKKKNIGIEDVRKVCNFLNLTASQSKYRVAIIDSIDDLSIQAANALLKTLEEPNKNTVMFLISHKKESILDTIRSRTIEINVKRPSKEEFLKVIKEDEEIYNLCSGSIGKAKLLLNTKIIETVDTLWNLYLNKNRDITKISEIAKFIKSLNNETTSIFWDIFLHKVKQQTLIQNKNIEKWFSINKAINEGHFRNMDIKDTIKIIFNT